MWYHRSVTLIGNLLCKIVQRFKNCLMCSVCNITPNISAMWWGFVCKRWWEAKAVRAIAQMFFELTFNGNKMWIKGNYCYLSLFISFPSFLLSESLLENLALSPKVRFQKSFPHWCALRFALLASFTADLTPNPDLLCNRGQMLTLQCVDSSDNVDLICAFILMAPVSQVTGEQWSQKEVAFWLVRG